jgi:hypothetical protein
VSSIAQERLTRRHRLKDAGFPFLAEAFVDAAEISNQAGNPFGHVGVEVVADHLPACHRGRRGEQIVQERHEIRLGAGIADEAADFARGYVKRGDQGFGAVPHILELPPFDVPGLHRQARSGAFQRLGIPVISSIDTVCTPCSAAVDRADIATLGVKVGIRLRRQPVTVAMRLEIGLFFKNRPTEPCEILLTMPRATACRASSLWLQ